MDDGELSKVDRGHSLLSRHSETEEHAPSTGNRFSSSIFISIRGA